MSYTPINWQTGDTITAEKMNKMDNGWSVSSGVTTLCDETVIPDIIEDDGVYGAELSISSITAPTITVTYDNTPYQCARDVQGGYGDEPDGTFSDYPFRIWDDGYIITQTGGAHTVKIEAVVTSVETSPQFAEAVANAYNSPLFQITLEKTTWQEAYDAMASGKIAYYGFEIDGSVEQYIATQAIYNMETEQYEIYAVGANTVDSIFALSSDGKLHRN